MNYTLIWSANTARGISTNQAHLICCGTVSMTGQDGGCKQRGQTATIRLKMLFMSRLAVCSRDLHWHWINYTLPCDTMEVSMLRLAWLPNAQHVFQPALTGRLNMLELISRKIDSCEREQRLSRWADFAKKIFSRELDARSYHDFAKNRHVCKIRKKGGPKNGVQHATAIYPIPQYTRPRYIGSTLYMESNLEEQTFEEQVSR